MSTIWERLSTPRRPSEPSEAATTPASGDREGVNLYGDFTDCLESYKGHALAAIAALTVPWGLYTRSVTPVVIGAMLGIVPEVLYANWRCDDKYRLFKRHMEAKMQQVAASQAQPPTGASRSGGSRSAA